MSSEEEEITRNCSYLFHSLPIQMEMRLQITIQYRKENQLAHASTLLQACRNTVSNGRMLLLSTCSSPFCCSSQKIALPSTQFLSLKSAACLQAFLSPVQHRVPSTFLPSSHHQHSPLLFTWWIYSVTSSLNSLQSWPFLYSIFL